MEFKYKDKIYMLAELKEPNNNVYYDMMAIFEYDIINQKYYFINYFYGADAPDEELISIAKEYIDRRK